MQQSHPEPQKDPIAEVFHLYDPPLWLVTAQAEGRRGGLIATLAVRASIVARLPRMALGLAKHHHTWGLVEASAGFALHLLAQDDLEAVWRFGLASGHDGDKLAGLPMEATPDGNPLYGPALAWMDCRIETRLDIGDRTLYLAQVSGASVLRQGAPLGVARLLAESPPKRRAELERLYARDQAIDAQAILDWRRTQCLGPDSKQC